MIEHTVKRKDVYRGTAGGKRQVMADVIEACSDTSRLEVITDVTVIRSSLPPRPGAVLHSQHVTHTSAGRCEGRGNGVTGGERRVRVPEQRWEMT